MTQVAKQYTKKKAPKTKKVVAQAMKPPAIITDDFEEVQGFRVNYVSDGKQFSEPCSSGVYRKVENEKYTRQFYKEFHIYKDDKGEVINVEAVEKSTSKNTATAEQLDVKDFILTVSTESGFVSAKATPVGTSKSVTNAVIKALENLEEITPGYLLDDKYMITSIQQGLDGVLQVRVNPKAI